MGKPMSLWLTTVIVAACCFLGAVVLIWRSLQTGAMSVALLIVLFAAMGLWQIAPMIRRKKSLTFTPDAPPQHVLPSP